MFGIELKDGVNNCHWNIERRCTNPDVTRNKVDKRFFSRDWDTKRNCGLTILGVHVCSEYKPQVD